MYIHNIPKVLKDPIVAFREIFRKPKISRLCLRFLFLLGENLTFENFPPVNIFLAFYTLQINQKTITLQIRSFLTRDMIFQSQNLIEHSASAKNIFDFARLSG